MSYPNLPLLRSSTRQREGGFQPARATNGTLKVRRLYAAEKTSFRLQHYLTESERATLEAAYVANRTANLTLTWPEDGSSYTVRFASAPQYARDGVFWIASVQLEEV